MSRWKDGLGKQCHCKDWDRCRCPWWAKHKGIRRSLRKWSLTSVENKTQARGALTRLRAEVQRYGTTAGKEEQVASQRGENMTVAMCVDRYKAEYCAVLNDKAAASALERIGKHFGERPLVDLEQAEPIQGWLQGLTTLTPRSRKVYGSRLRAMLNWAKARSWITRTGFDSREVRFEKDAQRTRILRPGEEAALLGACDRMDTQFYKFTGAQMKGRLFVALDTGVRQGTMLKLQNKHIDFATWTIRIPRGIAKDAEDLDVPVESQRLRAFLTARRGLGPDAYPFGHRDGTFQRDIKKAMRTVFKLAGLEFGRGDMVWHDLRHDAATKLVVDLGGPMAVVKNITGHATVAMLEKYVNPHEGQQRDLLRRLADFREEQLKAEEEERKTKQSGRAEPKAG